MKFLISFYLVYIFFLYLTGPFYEPKGESMYKKDFPLVINRFLFSCFAKLNGKLQIEALQEGKAYAYREKTSEKIVYHRLMHKTKELLVFLGDNNPAPEILPTTNETFEFFESTFYIFPGFPFVSSKLNWEVNLVLSILFLVVPVNLKKVLKLVLFPTVVLNISMGAFLYWSYPFFLETVSIFPLFLYLLQMVFLLVWA